MENGQVSGVVTLQEKLNDPQVAGVLVRLLDRMDSLEKAVDALATAVQEVPVMMSVVTDAVDDAYAQAAAQGIDLDERVRDTLVLLERLTAPETAAALDKLLNNPRLQRVPERMDRLLQTMDEKSGPLFDELHRLGSDLRVVVQEAQGVLKALSESVSSQGAMGAEVLRVLHELSGAARAVRSVADYLERHPEALLQGKRP